MKLRPELEPNDNGIFLVCTELYNGMVFRAENYELGMCERDGGFELFVKKIDGDKGDIRSRWVSTYELHQWLGGRREA